MEWLPTPVLLPGKCHEQRSLVGTILRGTKTWIRKWARAHTQLSESEATASEAASAQRQYYCSRGSQQSCWNGHTSQWWLWHSFPLCEKWNDFSCFWWHYSVHGTNICGTSHAHNSAELVTVRAQPGCKHRRQATEWQLLPARQMART